MIQLFSKGEEVAQHCEAGAAVDLLISDIGLPGEDGWHLLPRLRAKCPEFKAIAVTGYAGMADYEQSRTTGFDAWLPKPISFNELLETVDRLLPGIC